MLGTRVMGAFRILARTRPAILPAAEAMVGRVVVVYLLASAVGRENLISCERQVDEYE